MPPESPQYELLADGIVQGARWQPPEAPPRIVLRVLPEEPAAPRGEMLWLFATAEFADGSQTDVTPLARFTVADSRFATVDAPPVVHATEYGEPVILVSCLWRFATARVVVPQSFERPVPQLAPRNRVAGQHRRQYAL